MLKMHSDHYHTERLALRPWLENDKPAFASLNADPRVMEFFPELYTQEKSDWMVDECNRKLAKDGYTLWALERIDQKKFIGYVGLNKFEADLDFCPCVEIGWRLAFEQWGNGFATEAAQCCLSLGFTKFSLQEIFSFTTVSNARSRRVMEKLGMVDTGNNFLHPTVDSASGLQEHCLYKLSKNGEKTL